MLQPDGDHLSMVQSILEKWISSLKALFLRLFIHKDALLLWKSEDPWFYRLIPWAPSSKLHSESLNSWGTSSVNNWGSRLQDRNHLVLLTCPLRTFSSPFQTPSSSCSNSFFSCWMRHWIKFSKYKLKRILYYQEALCLVKQYNGWSPMSLQELLQPNWFCPYLKIFSHFTCICHINA